MLLMIKFVAAVGKKKKMLSCFDHHRESKTTLDCHNRNPFVLRLPRSKKSLTDIDILETKIENVDENES